MRLTSIAFGVWVATLAVVPVAGCATPQRQSAGRAAVESRRESPRESEESYFLSLINDYRASRGLGALQPSRVLGDASRWMAQDMAQHGRLDHVDSQGRGPGQRIAEFDYDRSAGWGENIAAGQEGARQTFDQWRGSPMHDRNMLDPDYRAIGVGRWYDRGSPYGWYWVTDFGSRAD
jgi:uncharacterized protein YkwD